MMKHFFQFKAPLSTTFVLLMIERAQAAPSSGGVNVGVKAGVLDGILNAGPMVQFLLLLLIGLSIVSWAIIFSKYKQYGALRAANARFGDRFWKATSLEAVFEKISEETDSSLARVFKVAFLELQKLAESPLATGAKPEAASTESSPARLAGIDNLERAVRKAIDTETAWTESRLNFLATTGSTAPFIGLLGTVIGIMTSFSHIAASGSASLAVVAPGISEALFATAVGLFAALPAVAAYNYFVSQVRRFEMELNNFGSDFLNIAKRNFFRDE